MEIRVIRKIHHVRGWPALTVREMPIEGLGSKDQMLYDLTRMASDGPGTRAWWRRVGGNGRMP